MGLMVRQQVFLSFQEEIFSLRLIGCRKAAGLSSTGLAARIGVTTSAVSKLENRVNRPDLDTLIRLADLFDTTTDYLLGRTDYPRRPTSMGGG
jgi:transcriptional regulator with XRE-family HTH domain